MIYKFTCSLIYIHIYFFIYLLIFIIAYLFRNLQQILFPLFINFNNLLMCPCFCYIFVISAWPFQIVKQQFYQQFGLFLLVCHVLHFGPSVYSVHSIVIVLYCYVLVFCLPCILLLSTLYKIAQKRKKKKRRKLEKKI